MSLVRAVVALLLALAFEAGLGRWVPSAHAYVDVMLVPLAWYGIARSQRSAMLVGCVAGLLQDAWFETGAFGLSGFKKTLLGWALGGLGGTFDLNHPLLRFLTGAVLAVLDRLLGFGLLRLLAQSAPPLAIGEILGRSLAGGLLVSLVFAILDRVRGRQAAQRKGA